MTKLLFIHGAGGTKNKWRHVSPYLDHARAEFIDLPGHGENHGLVPSSIEDYADRLSEEMTDDVIVVGHSMGGLIGIELAARNRHVKGLVLAASHYRLPVHPKFLQQLADGDYPDKFFYAAYGKQADRQLLKEEKEEHDATPVETAFRDFTSCNNYTSGKTQVSRLDLPILAVYGAEDRMIPPDSREKLTAANPSIKTDTIDGAGHYVILEAPGAFTEAVLRFQHFCDDNIDSE